MKLQKLSVIFLTLLSFIFTPISQPLAQTVNQIAAKIQAAYEKTQSMQMDFDQITYVEVLDKKVSKSGRTQFKKIKKFRIDYHGERGRRYFCNGKRLWIYKKGDTQVQVYPVNEKTVPAEALSFLGGLGHLRQDFIIDGVDSTKWQRLNRGPGNFNWLYLKPRQRRSQIEWLVLGVDPKQFLVQELYMYTQSGNLSHYQFKNHQINLSLDDKLFEFKKKGVKKIKIKP